ncbi:hypothetical protein OS493_028048 [Desmophyllum pertusum]|uniref:Uncharacterized protein n=1 Tax=Desmophyllum pertusum TaxID=174260 RepID=A0A9W9ZZI9_9CNID|nr:hypothetical protein OS493_028048 [Desmophyllum pertusum]
MGTGASSNSSRSTGRAAVNTAVVTSRWKKNARSSTTSNLAPCAEIAETPRASSQKEIKAEERHIKSNKKPVSPATSTSLQTPSKQGKDKGKPSEAKSGAATTAKLPPSGDKKQINSKEKCENYRDKETGLHKCCVKRNKHC